MNRPAAAPMPSALMRCMPNWMRCSPLPMPNSFYSVPDQTVVEGEASWGSGPFVCGISLNLAGCRSPPSWLSLTPLMAVAHSPHGWRSLPLRLSLDSLMAVAHSPRGCHSPALAFLMLANCTLDQACTPKLQHSLAGSIRLHFSALTPCFTPACPTHLQSG